MQIFRKIDLFLNSITMYRLTLYGLIIEILAAFALALFGLLSFTIPQLFLSLFIICITCLVTDKFFATIFKAVTNQESSLISAGILFLILAPISNTNDVLITILAGFIAMASKYLLTINKKHIFNPAALALVLIGAFGFGNAVWWIGSLVLLPITVVIGFLIVRKLRCFELVAACIFLAFITQFAFNLRNNIDIVDLAVQMFSSWPLVFFVTVMATEPLTVPGTKNLKILYGSLIGILFGSQFSFGPIFSSPEFALIIGNIFAYITGSRIKLFLKFKEKRKIANNVYEYVFQKNKPFNFLPGQYMLWTLPSVPMDARGNRRYFTLASSPTENEVKIGIKYDLGASSSFKKILDALDEHDKIIADQLAGGFILPHDLDKKLVFIAGGIGITPFRSMVKYLIDTKQNRDIVLFYFATSENEFAYRELFDLASAKILLKIVYVVTGNTNLKDWQGERGRLTSELIQKYCPDYAQRIFYISGPNIMVDSYKKLLKKLNVTAKNIITDYFPGF